MEFPFTADQVWIAGGWTSGWLCFTAAMVYFFRLLATGRIRTAREVNEIRQDRDARVHEALAWKSVAEENGKIIREQAQQISQLLSTSEVQAHVLNSLPRGEGRGDGST